MLVIYIISAIASFCAPIFQDREEYKKSSVATAVAITCAFWYSVSAIGKISQNIFDPHFGTFFGLLSLLFWNFAFLSDDGANCLSYIVAAFLASAVLCFICSNIQFSNYLVACNESHKYTEHIEIVTTVDGLESGESIYGDGFVVGKYISFNPNITFYRYYFQAEDGSIDYEDIRANRTEITYIDAGVAPYIEITYVDICKGYRKETKNHVFGGRLESYHLYIPKDSIQTNINPAS